MRRSTRDLVGECHGGYIRCDSLLLFLESILTGGLGLADPTTAIVASMRVVYTFSNRQGTLRRFHPFHPFRLFRPLDNFITFPCLYSTSPSLSNSPSFSVNFRVFPLFHLYPGFHFPLSFYPLFFYSLSSYSLFFPSLFLSRVPLFSVLFIV